MVWIVITENPKPDKYIPILVRRKVEVSELDLRHENFKIFDNLSDALSYAVDLRDSFNASYIRIFYSEGYSKNYKK